MNRDELMLRAVALAERNAASVTGGPFGAVIVKDGKVVAEASNTVTVDNDPTAHAEVNAIRKACAALGTFDLSGCELYTSCEPCPMCLAACYWAHIDREVALPVDGRKIPFVHIMEKEGLRPFMLWASNDKKVEY